MGNMLPVRGSAGKSCWRSNIGRLGGCHAARPRLPSLTVAAADSRSVGRGPLKVQGPTAGNGRADKPGCPAQIPRANGGSSWPQTKPSSAAGRGRKPRPLPWVIARRKRESIGLRPTGPRSRKEPNPRVFRLSATAVPQEPIAGTRKSPQPPFGKGGFALPPTGSPFYPSTRIESPWNSAGSFNCP